MEVKVSLGEKYHKTILCRVREGKKLSAEEKRKAEKNRAENFYIFKKGNLFISQMFWRARENNFLQFSARAPHSALQDQLRCMQVHGGKKSALEQFP